MERRKKKNPELVLPKYLSQRHRELRRLN